MAPGEIEFGKTGQNKHKQRLRKKESIADLASPPVHILLHSLMPGTQPLELLSVCTYGLFGTSLRHKVSHVGMQ